MEIRTRQKAPQTIELSSVPYVLLFDLFSSLLLFFSFFVEIFFLAFAHLIFFLSKEHTRINSTKFELNWTKDVAYTNLGL
jgi:hypothetical protein